MGFECPSLSSKLRRMSVTIDRVHAHFAECALGFTYSSGEMSVGRSVIWEIHASGQVGLGENTVPRLDAPRHAGRFTDQHRSAIEEYAGPLIGRDPVRLETLLGELPPFERRDLRVLREGLSIALYDLVGKIHSIPAHTLLGGKKRDRAPGMPVIHVGPPEVMARRAKAWVDHEYHHIKVKFRGDLEVDVEAIRTIRKTIGDDIEMVVDANDGYDDVEDAIRAIEALEPCNIYYFEDMLYEPIEAFVEMRRRTGAKVMVDLQAAWPQIHDVARLEAADVINHHPNNQGGLKVALDIDAVATAAGIETAIGSSGHFSIQNTAFQVLSSVIGLTRPCEDIGLVPYYDGPTKGEYKFDVEPSAIKAPYPIIEGVIHIPDEPGLGIELDRAKLTALTVDTIELH